MHRSLASRLAHETVAIVEAGVYRTARGADVSIARSVRAAVEGTVEYAPDAPLPAPRRGAHETSFAVVNASAVDVGRDLAAPGDLPLLLNFASAKHPGGGFLNGARAQEESLARASALYACIAGRKMYPHHLAQHDAAYTSWAIYSPGVPVFREEAGALLDAPYLAAILTCAAANAKVVLEREPHRASELRQRMEERIHRVLSIAQAHGHGTLVLGAWGCGVFGNDPAEIARAFQAAFAGAFCGAFRRVTYAVLDGSVERRFIRPFEEVQRVSSA